MDLSFAIGLVHLPICGRSFAVPSFLRGPPASFQRALLCTFVHKSLPDMFISVFVEHVVDMYMGVWF